MKNINSLLLAAALVVISCSTVADTLDAATVQANLAHANSQYALAVESNFAWTTTKKILAEAKTALEAGDLAQADKLTSKALHQANGSLAQAEVSANSWQDNIVE